MDDEVPQPSEGTRIKSLGSLLRKGGEGTQPESGQTGLSEDTPAEGKQEAEILKRPLAETLRVCLEQVTKIDDRAENSHFRNGAQLFEEYIQAQADIQRGNYESGKQIPSAQIQKRKGQVTNFQSYLNDGLEHLWAETDHLKPMDETELQDLPKEEQQQLVAAYKASQKSFVEGVTQATGVLFEAIDGQDWQTAARVFEAIPILKEAAYAGAVVESLRSVSSADLVKAQPLIECLLYIPRLRRELEAFQIQPTQREILHELYGLSVGDNYWDQIIISNRLDGDKVTAWAITKWLGHLDEPLSQNNQLVQEVYDQSITEQACVNHLGPIRFLLGILGHPQIQMLLTEEQRLELRAAAVQTAVELYQYQYPQENPYRDSFYQLRRPLVAQLLSHALGAITAVQAYENLQTPIAKIAKELINTALSRQDQGLIQDLDNLDQQKAGNG
ncbi:hypothetical protein A2W24_01385 [Microgenomates group bacterium RBG_16_45_19]|nr:MAG: hypothetical protein A2W24_01385 [Microgenomates group bacterium RBG_16_45_19]